MSEFHRYLTNVDVGMGVPDLSGLFGCPHVVKGDGCMFRNILILSAKGRFSASIVSNTSFTNMRNKSEYIKAPCGTPLHIGLVPIVWTRQNSAAVWHGHIDPMVRGNRWTQCSNYTVRRQGRAWMTTNGAFIIPSYVAAPPHT